MEVDMDEDVENDLVVVVVECQKRDGRTNRQHNYIYRYQDIFDDTAFLLH